MAIQDGSNLEILQELEEFPQKVCSPHEERWEKDLTDTLLEISEKILEDDQKSTEWLIGTGWEEAACGWGPISATACLHPQKKQKKLKPGDTADCILCLDLCFIHESKDTATETKSSTVTNHKDKSATETSLADHNLLPAEKDFESCFPGHCPSTAMVSKTETCRDKVSSVEVSVVEQRHNEKSLQRSSSPFTGRAIPICTNCYHTKKSLMFNVPMLLPPLKASPGHSHAEQMARRKEILLQQLDKLPSRGFIGSALPGKVLQNIDLRVERKLLEAITDFPQELKVLEPLSFGPLTSCVPKTPLKDPDRLQWQNLITQRSIAVNANTVKHSTNSAPVGILHTRTMQNKRNIRQEVRPLNDTKIRRAKSSSGRVPDAVLLPSLTVTRVEIPVKLKLC
ncbi:uncharacterized protein C16orf46 homolog [Leptodactylus fuscus]|uniref:uncharacterized protein C16orf46 homolog n=1 Tax=Leptodactylus fuscus TaxID=238119 RepID=UPI003F4ED623